MCIFILKERKFNLKNSHRLSILEGWFWESIFLKLYSDDHEKFYSKLFSCLGTGWEIKINSYNRNYRVLPDSPFRFLRLKENSHCVSLLIILILLHEPRNTADIEPINGVYTLLYTYIGLSLNSPCPQTGFLFLLSNCEFTRTSTSKRRPFEVHLSWG